MNPNDIVPDLVELPSDEAIEEETGDKPEPARLQFSQAPPPVPPHAAEIPLDNDIDLRPLADEEGGERRSLPKPPPPSAQIIANSRRHRRTACRVAVTVHTDHNFFGAESGNISEGGIFVATERAMPVGTRLLVVIDLPDGGRYEVDAEVRWASPGTSESPMGLGLRFLSLSKEAERAISAFVASRELIIYAEV